MRRCVFLAVLLSLVLSLSKGTETEKPSTTTVETATTPTATTPTTTTQTTTVETATTPTATTPTTTTQTTTVETATTPTATTPTTTTQTTTVETATTPTATTPTTTTQTTTVETATTPTTTTGTETDKPSTTTVQTTTAPTTTTQTTTVQTTTMPTTTTQTTTTGKETEKPSTTTAPTTTAGTGTATPETTSPSSPADENFCTQNPCGSSFAICLSLNTTFACQCQYGFYYSNDTCYEAKQFHWIITLKEIYSDSVQKTNSKEYEEVFNKLKEFFGKTFSSLDGYEQTVIVEIQPETKGRAASPMRVTVTNLFKKETTVDDKDVSSAINDAIKADPSYVTDYKVTDNCAGFNCDNRTSVCEPGEFPKCVCKSDFSKTKWDDRSCSDCRKDCSAASNEYCVMENELPTCKCLPNFKRDSGTCVSCAVGYSGENCNDDTELILIIVGTVLGAIILILVIVISVVSVRARSRQDPEKKSLIKPEHSNSHISDDRRTTMFPRVQTTSGHANPGYQPNNPYESRFTSRGRFPERDYDDMYEASREPDGFRMQRRY